MNKFSKKFDSFACAGDTIQVSLKNLRIIAKIEYDTDYRIDDDDCHNPDQSATGCNDDQQARLLAARNVWQKGEWFYCGIVLSVWIAELCVSENSAALWGIECNYPDGDNSYLTEVANELLPEALADATQLFEGLLKSVEQAESELAELSDIESK